MKLKNIYFILLLAGAVFPMYQFLEFLYAHGMDFSLMIDQLFATPISRFFAYDLMLSALVFLVFMYREGKILHFRHLWIYLACTLLIGLSVAFPLFLYVREVNSDIKP